LVGTQSTNQNDEPARATLARGASTWAGRDQTVITLSGQKNQEQVSFYTASAVKYKFGENRPAMSVWCLKMQSARCQAVNGNLKLI